MIIRHLSCEHGGHPEHILVPSGAIIREDWERWDDLSLSPTDAAATLSWEFTAEHPLVGWGGSFNFTSEHLVGVCVGGGEVMNTDEDLSALIWAETAACVWAADGNMQWMVMHVMKETHTQINFLIQMASLAWTVINNCCESIK